MKAINAMNIITPELEFVKKKITEIKKTLSVFRQARLKEEITMVIVTPDSDFVKRKIEVKEKPPVCRKAVNEQEVIESYKKMKAMNIITPELKFVKRKILEAGKDSAGSVPPTHNQQTRGDFPASAEYNPVVILKNTIEGRSDVAEGISEGISEGKNAPLGKKLDLIRSDPIGSGFFGGKNGGNTTLLETSEITSPRKGQKRKKTGVLSIEQCESRRDNCDKYVREFETKCCGRTYFAEMSCGLRTCPFCARKRMLDRTRKVIKFVKSLDANREKYDHRLRFITFGYGTKDGIKEGMKKSLKAFERIRDNLLETQREKYVDQRDKKTKKRKTEGCVWSVELGPKNLSIHIHVLYWGKYIPQKVLSNEWKRLTGKFYVDIRYAKNKSKKKKGLWGIVLETTKYIMKGLIDLDEETAFRIERELFNIRTFGTSGIFYGKIKTEKPECPFCGSDEGFFYIGVEKKSRHIMTAIDIQRQFWKDL